MKNLLFILVLILFSCTSRKSEETSNAISDSSKSTPAFNKSEELYIVFKIGRDSIDPNGNKCKMVEMKSASDKYFTSCMSDQIPGIGDSVWIGYDKSGKPYMLSMNKEQ